MAANTPPDPDGFAPDGPAPDERQTFADLGVIPEIEQALARVGITHPFPIQALAIPIAIQGTDMIGQARTGTGKTLAFGISVLQRIAVPGEAAYENLKKPGAPQALIMAPTRELALQVTRDLDVASTVRHARVLTVYGGVGYDAQLENLSSGVDVVVGTPGRLKDLADKRLLDLSHVRVLVLDEADEMLDLGFLPDVERLIAKTPSDRQTLLFSATMPSAIVALARMHLSHPINVRAEAHDAQATVPDTTQFVYQAHDLDKPEIVARLLQAEGAGRVMIFCRTKRATQRLADDLEDRGFSSTAIHGDLNQAARERALKKFREGKANVLVATDVAARGIDVTGVTHVVNYECPDDEKTYIHRIGRTGRAGASGVAVTLVDWADSVRWKVINKTLELPFEELVETYSNSPNLYTDLGIPAGTKGRLPGAVKKSHDHSEDYLEKRGDKGDRRKGGERRREGGRESGEERPRAVRADRPERSRRRTRNGEEVLPSGEPVAKAEQGEGAASATRRRRRRGRGGGSAAATENQ